jgi:hypothetical protein
MVMPLKLPEPMTSWAVWVGARTRDVEVTVVVVVVGTVTRWLTVKVLNTYAVLVAICVTVDTDVDGTATLTVAGIVDVATGASAVTETVVSTAVMQAQAEEYSSRLGQL